MPGRREDSCHCLAPAVVVSASQSIILTDQFCTEDTQHIHQLQLGDAVELSDSQSDTLQN